MGCFGNGAVLIRLKNKTSNHQSTMCLSNREVVVCVIFWIFLCYNSAKKTNKRILGFEAFKLMDLGWNIEVLTSQYTFLLATLRLPDVETGLAVAMVMMDKCPLTSGVSL